VYLLLVLVAGVGTAWWAGHRIGLDLSSVTAAASILGLTDSSREAHVATGYRPSTDVQTTQTQVAPYCQAGQTPTFAAAATALKQQVGDVLGTPVECEHPSAPAGDTIQQTTTGLLAYNKLTNTLSFTDGWRHWAQTPRGPVTWEGTDPNPPPG